MKFTAATSELAQKLQPVAHIASTRSGLAAVGGVLIQVDGSAIQLRATDLEMSISVPVEGGGEAEGSALVPARLLLEVVRMSPGGEVACETDGEQNLEVLSKGSAIKLRMMRQEDFPRLPDVDGEDATILPAAIFANAVGQVSRSASRDETRPLLTGILLDARESTLRLVATDSYRLAVKEVTLSSPLSGELAATVPARALSELARLSQQGDAGELRASITSNQIAFSIGGMVLSSRLLDGHFPDYRQLLPESSDHELHFATDELLDVVKRVSLVAQKNAPLSLSLRDGEMTVGARTPDVGEARETIPADFHGEPFEIGFNPTYLREGLESASSPRVVLKLASPLRPGVIEADGGGEGERFLYLVMPVRLGS